VDLGTGALYDGGDAPSILNGGTLKTTKTGVYAAGFTQQGGTHAVAQEFTVGGYGSQVTYELQAGHLIVGGAPWGAYESIGSEDGRAIFVQSGGTHEVYGSCILASTFYGDHKGGGLYLLSGGSHSIAVDLSVSDSGVYSQSGGVLTVSGDETIGFSEQGTFVQTGGTHTVAGTLIVGGYGERTDYGVSSGAFNAVAGSLVAGNLYVGFDEPAYQGSHSEVQGLFQISSSAMRIEVKDTFELGMGAIVTAVDGATIHMTGHDHAAFVNHCYNEPALLGLAKLTLLFEGGTDNWATFEVAGQDLGPNADGFDLNFVLGTLAVGGDHAALLRLEDVFDNGNRSSPEALYVHDLTVGPGSVLDLAGLSLYYDGTFVNEGTVMGGEPAFAAPEPATLGLMALGVVGALLRRRRPRGA
jgi:hypothetical protein